MCVWGAKKLQCANNCTRFKTCSFCLQVTLVTVTDFIFHSKSQQRKPRHFCQQYRAPRAGVSCYSGLIYVCKGQGPGGRVMMPAPQTTLHCMRFGAFGCQAPHPHLVRLECIGHSGRGVRRCSTDRLSGQRQRRKLPEGTRARGALSGRGAWRT